MSSSFVALIAIALSQNAGAASSPDYPSGGASNPWSSIRVDTNAIEIPLRPQATVENFESYTLGQLVPQGGWFNLTDTNDRVVTGALAGNSARHSATGTNNGALQIMSWDFPFASHLATSRSMC